MVKLACMLAVNHYWLKDVNDTIVVDPRTRLYSVAGTSIQSTFVEIIAACHYSAPVRLAN